MLVSPTTAFSDSMSYISRLPSRLSIAPSTTHIVSHPENMVVRLKADDIGFGLSLGGGASEHNNYPLVISSIEPGGPAARCVCVEGREGGGGSGMRRALVREDR